MTTVGFGDVYPTTNGGRVIGMITSLWAVFFVSLFTVSLATTLRMSSSQYRAYILLKRLLIRKDIRKNAC